MSRMTFYTDAPVSDISAKSTHLLQPKRLLDMSISSFLLIVLSPFLFTIAVLIKLESPGSSFFCQKRYGLNGHVFKIYKFRTLHQSYTNPTGGAQIIEDDPRLTAMGRWLRSWSLDELPQLYNIFKGEMSFVGPRPHAIDHHDYYKTVIPDYEQRLLVLPGLTGLAQIQGYRGATPTLDLMQKRLTCDLIYIQKQSFKYDLIILSKTIFPSVWRGA
jgi:putative colanic acid biosysnthesis UDP-glucose lipid carrier transferase